MMRRVKESLMRRMPYRRLTSIFKSGPARMDELRSAFAPVMVEPGRDPSVVVIAFTGDGQKLMLPVYEFFDTTKSLGYSRILLRDQYRQRYDCGIDALRPDFPSLIAYLRQEVERLKAKKVLCIGTSSGGYAALRAGHQLGADYVHAFGPRTGDGMWAARAPKGPRPMWPGRHGLLRYGRKRFTNLDQVLKNWNRKTTYDIHYGRGCGVDRWQAERLFESPGVVSLGYPCDTHLIAVFLAKKNFLTEALTLASQDRLVEIARAHFHDAVEVNDFRTRAASGCPE